ncbi:MAG: hypothetical protein ABSC19_06005 [Syntrophorhabdales bacterium]|jgi:ABC-type ATPase with predicted acetyltransferase domain
MSEKREYDFQGRKVLGQEIDVKTEKDDWNIYRLADGTVVKVKTVIISIAKLDEYDPAGNPVYVVNASPVIGMDVPPNLKKRT